MKQDCINWKMLLVGMGTAILTSSILCAGAAQLLSAGVVGEAWINYVASAVLVGASFLGGMIAGGPWEAFGSGLGLWVLLIGVNMVCYDFEMRGGGETLLAILGGSGAAMLLRFKGHSARKRRKKSKIVKMNKKLH